MSIINRCPECKGTDIHKHKDYGCAFIVFLFISMGLGVIMIPFLPTKYRCSSCGTEWK